MKEINGSGTFHCPPNIKKFSISFPLPIKLLVLFLFPCVIILKIHFWGLKRVSLEHFQEHCFLTKVSLMRLLGDKIIFLAMAQKCIVNCDFGLPFHTSKIYISKLLYSNYLFSIYILIIIRVQNLQLYLVKCLVVSFPTINLDE